MTYWKHNMPKCKNIIIVANSPATPRNIHTIPFSPHGTNLKNDKKNNNKKTLSYIGYEKAESKPAANIDKSWY